MRDYTSSKRKRREEGLSLEKPKSTSGRNGGSKVKKKLNRSIWKS